MIARYSFAISAICPVNGAKDHYEATVEAARPIMVEDILAAVADAIAVPSTQEEICGRLRHLLPGRVTIVGYHSGVRVEVIEP